MKKHKVAIFGIVSLFFVFITLYRLDARYFFTDEALYVNAGRGYVSSDYTLNLQHPLIGKYISATTSGNGQNNVFLLRLPFAILGILSSFLVFIIIKDELGFWWGNLGTLIYVSMPFIWSTNRMVLLESPMHFFWLCFSYCILNYYKRGGIIYCYGAGVALGLAISVKFTSVILSVTLITTGLSARFVLKERNVIGFRNYVSIFAISFITFTLHYTHLILSLGFEGLENVIRAFKDVILVRNSEGKTHVIDNRIYEKSPWWFYLYYLDKSYGKVRAVLTGPLFVLGTSIINVYALYWLVMFLLTLIYFQMLPLKNSRYIASMELPLTFLIVLGLAKINKKYGNLFVVIASILIVIPTLKTVYYSKPDSYHAAYLIISKDTNNFTNGKRILIFGSVRSSKWYFNAPEDVVVIRKDTETLQDEFNKFKYILVDTNERLKYKDNVLFSYLEANKSEYQVQYLDNVLLYVRKNN